MKMYESERDRERRKCEHYRNVIHALCNGTFVKLNEKMWIQTETQGYQFTAVSVMDCMDLMLPSIKIYNEDNFIHCDSRLLNSVQLKELARIVADSVLS